MTLPLRPPGAEDQLAGGKSTAVLWGRSVVARFCPDCLGRPEAAGICSGAWAGRSPAFAISGCLLADCCPQCEPIPRQRSSILRAVPEPRRCGNPPTGPDRSFTNGCGFDLTEVDTLKLESDHPALLAQAVLTDTIEKGTADFGVYALAPQPSVLALSDVRAVCGRVLSTLSESDLVQWTADDIAGAHLHPRPGCTLAARAGDRPGFMTPPRAVSAATAVTAALHVLSQPDIHQAGSTLRPLLETIRGEGDVQVSPTSIGQWSRRTSPILAAVHIAALAPSCRPIDYLRHRLPTPIPRLPRATDQDIERRCRKVSSVFWGSWAVRLAPPDAVAARILHPALAACLLIVGTRIGYGRATRHLGNVIGGTDVSRVLQLLDDHPCWPDIVTALVRLADHLDSADVPIDYARRRSLDYTRLLPAERWAAICRRTGTARGEGLREQIMRCYLFQRISGQAIEAAPGHPGINDAGFRTEYVRFTALRTPEVAQALDDEARAFLAAQNIHDEPVIWHPPVSLMDGLVLPGADPDRVDVHLLHGLVRQRKNPARYAAGVLGASVEAVRYLLDQHPAPIPQPVSTGRVLQRAMETLPRTELARLYLDEHCSLKQIANLTGFSRGVLTRLAREYGISLRSGPRDYKRRGVVEADWLFEQYVVRLRTLGDLAREKDMSTANMTRWAHTHNVPLRRGAASHAATHRVNQQAARAPAFLRDALTNPYTWGQLERFVAALPYPTMREAAHVLGISQSTLVAQIRRLERDLGRPLIERAERGRRMRPTPFGEKVAAAVERLIGPSGRP